MRYRVIVDVDLPDGSNTHPSDLLDRACQTMRALAHTRVMGAIVKEVADNDASYRTSQALGA